MRDLAQDGAQPAAHSALPYASTDEFVTGALGFLEAGFGEDEPVLVSAPHPEIGLLRAWTHGLTGWTGPT